MNCKRCSRVSIFFSFLRLGCLAFGGPIAHLGYFRDEYVRRRKWMTEAEYADLVALCQFLPGPASSQVGFAIGYRQGGLAGALLACLGFTLPSAALMTGFALGVAGLQDFSGAGWIAGLKLAAVAVVAHAILEMGSKLCPDAARIMIALGSAALLLLLSSAPWQLGVIAGGALIGLCLFQEKAIQPEAPVERPARAGSGAGWYLILFSLLLLGISLLRGIRRAVLALKTMAVKQIHAFRLSSMRWALPMSTCICHHSKSYQPQLSSLSLWPYPLRRTQAIP